MYRRFMIVRVFCEFAGIESYFWVSEILRFELVWVYVGF